MTEIRRLVLFFRPYSAQLVLGITAAVLVAVAWLYVPRYISSQIDTRIGQNHNQRGLLDEFGLRGCKR